ncbi:uncharacterized protein BHQ10_003632 [Talaromyces amestolkiae]|uniref:Uncharacterized protein n=1 Tax=Talaromyces amestolkiae TaxID=1196081 RepID=A0A364KVP6_TALAM|nr:uncharacterized protein BHQ10_003632 [Talaromyces amestolkiae]RAO67620.1 hypothetical protein BHQ10_003632 [Talaromyces amestolkiae]
MKLVATLCIAESCIGEVVSAEYHIQALLSILDLRESGELAGEKSVKGEDEVAERLLVAAHQLTAAVKSRLNDHSDRRSELTQPWHVSFSSIPNSQAGVRLIPFHNISATSRHVTDVDAFPFIVALRGLTRAVTQQHVVKKSPHHLVQPSHGAFPRNICDGDDPQNCLGCTSMTALMYAIARANAASFFPATDRSNMMFCAFGTVAIPWNRGFCGV